MDDTHWVEPVVALLFCAPSVAFCSDQVQPRSGTNGAGWAPFVSCCTQEAAPPATLLKRIATSAAGPAGAASVAAALRAMSLQALRETSRWELLRTPGLVATLIAIAGGDDDAQVPDLDQSEDFAAENSAGTLQRHERRRGQAAEADDDRRRLAAKTLAHMGEPLLLALAQ